MSKISDLIAKLCPNGVEYKEIGSFAECYAGATPKTGVSVYFNGYRTYDYGCYYF